MRIAYWASTFRSWEVAYVDLVDGDCPLRKGLREKERWVRDILSSCFLSESFMYAMASILGARSSRSGWLYNM